MFGDAEYREKKITVWDRIQSAISRNDGSTWQALPVPRTPAFDPVSDQCHGLVCNLQVHGPDAWWRGDYNLSYAGFYSHPSAVGMAITTGNSGAYLSYDPAHINTYLSADGGDSWTRVAKGAFIYEFGDWGSIVAMAKHAPSGEASEVLFSLDQGNCWTSVALSRPMTVRNIITDPQGAGRRFILFGVFNGADGTRKGQGGIYVLVRGEHPFRLSPLRVGGASARLQVLCAPPSDAPLAAYPDPLCCRRTLTICWRRATSPRATRSKTTSPGAQQHPRAHADTHCRALPPLDAPPEIERGETKLTGADGRHLCGCSVRAGAPPCRAC